MASDISYLHGGMNLAPYSGMDTRHAPTRTYSCSFCGRTSANVSEFCTVGNNVSGMALECAEGVGCGPAPLPTHTEHDLHCMCGYVGVFDVGEHYAVGEYLQCPECGEVVI